ncbi:S9 family peptidase [Pleionea sediminis]|uniref:S9 family peptidase n=1 Tax=Pleionea sediminis TaxID=2569479 RepID=UPI001184AE6E|nr:prolyl oligopeptidase family serine peptidase [Pleionea sediminis]
MKEKEIKPYASWTSPITAEMVAAKGTRLGHVQVFDGKVYWLESRPHESGRGVVVLWDGQSSKDVTPRDVNVGSKVHEYGGGDFLVLQAGLVYSQADDQRVYILRDGESPVALTDEPEKKKGWRYADFTASPSEKFIYAVREDHHSVVVKNELVMIDVEKSVVTVIAEGFDFYSFPRVSPDGGRLCWTCWNHPQMPWDGTELWVADIAKDGSISAEHKACGGMDESIYQPAWSPDGVLHFVSDRSGWWNLYSFRDGVMNALMPTDNDCGIAQWNFGTSTYCFGCDDNIYLCYFEEGQQSLAHLNVDTGHVEPMTLPFREYPGQIHIDNNKLYVLAGAPVISLDLFEIDLSNGHYKTIREKHSLPVSHDFISLAKPIQFTSSNGYQAHGYFYEPAHPNYQADESEKPPLIVMSHSGPTSIATTTLNWAVQFWTSRGFAVVDVNYGGSVGYGRAYRNLLRHNWGVNDVNDCVYAARFLVEDELVDGKRLLIRGGSAGGFTTLCALTFTDDFAAGMTRYGVADLEALVSDGHKFEARYLDSLVGPYPESKSVYVERSPIHHTDDLSCPMLVLQGAEDKVVPPQQSQQLVKALSEKDIPHAYIEFEGEGHGFRQKDNIIRALEAELVFYRQVLSIQSEEVLPELELTASS